MDSDRRRMRRRASATFLAGASIGGAAVVFVLRRIARDWEAAEEAIRGADPAWIAGGLALAVITVLGQGAGWRSALRLVGVRIPFARTLVWYLAGEVGKYFPGGIWPILGRGELARRGGVPRPRAYMSVVLSLALLYLAAMFVAVGLLPFALGAADRNAWMGALLLLPVGIAVLHHRVLERLVALVARVSRREIDVIIPRWADSLRVLLAYAPTWVTTGLATVAVARALDPSGSPTRIVFAAVLSWIAGLLAVPVPAGAGVREAVFVATCGLGGGVAAAVAIIARLLFTIVDGGGAIIAALLLRRDRAGAVIEPLR